MPFNRFEWLSRMKAVEREYLAALLAVERLAEQIRTDPLLLKGELKPRDLSRAAELLEGTYIIRLFAEFETALRRFWTLVRSTDPPGRTQDLIQGVAATCRIGNVELDGAHDVRKYRNTLVHER